MGCRKIIGRKKFWSRFNTDRNILEREMPKYTHAAFRVNA